MKTLSLDGQKFGRLTVVKRVENNKFGKSMWLCQCDCGGAKTVLGAKLMNGETKSCGCWRSEVVKIVNKTHGQSYTALNNRYRAMIGRCHNPSHSSYAAYGGRGIKVCDRWRNSYQAFLDDMGEPPPGFTLDRIDNSKGYSPDNCRWASPKMQAANSSKVRVVSYNGKTANITDWAKHLGISTATLIERLKKWPIDEALTMPKSTKWSRRKITR
jgi:hypothetical protein